MLFRYEEKEEKYRFKYWLNCNQLIPSTDFYFLMDVNQWVADHFGEIGVKWGWNREIVTQLKGGIRWNILHPTAFIHSWRFRDKSDAMLFKMKWHY